jgi:hypothetical protein
MSFQPRFIFLGNPAIEQETPCPITYWQVNTSSCKYEMRLVVYHTSNAHIHMDMGRLSLISGFKLLIYSAL